jgi:hypothetical protein
MQTGTIRRQDNPRVLGTWRADAHSIVVETDDPTLRNASDEILRTPQRIPVHGADRYEFATQAEPLIEAPATIKYLSLFALELERLGFLVEPDDD